MAGVLSKFLHGLAFGAGLAIAFATVWVLWMCFVVPPVMQSFVAAPRAPTFENPTEAKGATPDPGGAKREREFNFFKHGKSRMEIPQGGGILALVPVSTPAGEDRPRTYQLWLTEKALWQVRTTGDKAQSEPLARPENANVEDLDRLVREQLGSTARKSMMTVSEVDIHKLRSTGTSWRDDSLNGKLSITVDGIVFLVPNPY
jgi:hypothetical protein